LTKYLFSLRPTVPFKSGLKKFGANGKPDTVNTPRCRESQAIFPSKHHHGLTKPFQTSGGRETTLALRKATKTLMNLTSFVVTTTEVFQKHTFSVWNICDHHRRNVRSPKRPILETASPNRPRRNVLDHVSVQPFSSQVHLKQNCKHNIKCAATILTMSTTSTKTIWCYHELISQDSGSFCVLVTVFENCNGCKSAVENGQKEQNNQQW